MGWIWPGCQRTIKTTASQARGNINFIPGSTLHFGASDQFSPKMLGSNESKNMTVSNPPPRLEKKKKTRCKVRDPQGFSLRGALQGVGACSGVADTSPSMIVDPVRLVHTLDIHFFQQSPAPIHSKKVQPRCFRATAGVLNVTTTTPNSP